MDKVLYNSLCRYFNALSKLGSVSYSQVDKLLVLIFYKHFVYEDYRGYLSKEDYRSIEMASRYSHIQDAMLSRYTKAIPIKPEE